MSFENRKHNTLAKLQTGDKSKKGAIDQPIAELVQIINGHKDFYTTSSCSGRVILLAQPESGRKHQTKCLLISHHQVSLKQVNEALVNLPEQQVWFRFEPLILHVTARSLPQAEKLVKLVRKAGLKRSGIQSVQGFGSVEICSTEKIDTIVADQGRLLVGQNYLKILVREANKRFIRNKEKITKIKHLFTGAF